MKHFFGHTIILLLLFGVTARSEDGTAGRISVFGSSVASGAAATDHQGYWFMMKEVLAERGWQVSSCSRGGDRTTRILDRFDQLLAQHPEYVFIGLSLANEGLRDTDESGRDAVCRQYRWGMQSLIALVRAQGMKPVVGLCYPHGDYTAEEYKYVKRMNVLINSWDVPSVNFLGASGDGHGRWVPAYENDPGHPNTEGHREMFHAIVPSLFDALKEGKTTPQWAPGEEYMTLGGSSGSSLRYAPDEPMHSWASVFSVRLEEDGAIASIAGKSAEAVLTVKGGTLTYLSSRGDRLVSTIEVADREWHQVVLSHRYAQQETQLHVDGRLAGTVSEQLPPRSFMLGAAGPGTAGFMDWLVYRAALNDLEVESLFDGHLLQASLEVYAPLRDAPGKEGAPMENRAQSLSEVVRFAAPVPASR